MRALATSRTRPAFALTASDGSMLEELAADHDLPESRACAADRLAEPLLRIVRGVACHSRRSRDCLRHLRHRPRDADRRKPLVTERRVLHTHERTGATTSLLTIRREDKNEPMSLEAVLALAKSSGSPSSSIRAHIAPRCKSRRRASRSMTAASRSACVSSVRCHAMRFRRRALAASHWQIATEDEFTALWLKELEEIPADPIERVSSRDRPPAARLETSAARGEQGLSPSNR